MAGSPKGRKAALGFRTHSGSACAILAVAQGNDLEIIDRRHVTLYDLENGGAKQPYHAAESMPSVKAERYISRCRDTTDRLAREILDSLKKISEQRGLSLSGVCVIAANGRALPGLGKTLASHALIHAAEGEFYRVALLGAAEVQKISANRLNAKDAAQLASLLNVNEKTLTEKLATIGKRVGRPWTQDEKLATMAAWWMLAK